LIVVVDCCIDDDDPSRDLAFKISCYLLQLLNTTTR